MGILSKLFKKKKRSKVIYFNTGLNIDSNDDRDYEMKVGNTKTSYSYFELNTPEIRNQEDTNSCCSHSVVRAIEIQLLNKYPNRFIEGSELYHYYNARKMNNTYPKDSGMTMREGCKAMLEYGYVPEYAWKWDKNKINEEPNQVAYWFNSLYKLDRYERVFRLEEIKQSLIDKVSVVFGLKLSDNYYNLDYVNCIYKPKGKYHGGHAQVIVGYDDELSHFIVENSWGESFGRKGRYYLPYEVYFKDGFDAWRIIIK